MSDSNYAVELRLDEAKGGATARTLLRRIGYGGRKGRSAARRLLALPRHVRTLNVWSTEQIAEFQRRWDSLLPQTYFAGRPIFTTTPKPEDPHE